MYNGYANFVVTKELPAVSTSYYIIQKNKYEFFISCGEKSRAKFEIPMAKIENGEYYEEGTFEVSQNNSYFYVSLSSSSGYAYKKSLGLLYCDRKLMLFDGDSLFFESDEGLMQSNAMPQIIAIRTSSFLSEGKTTYDGCNILDISKFGMKPWVEGAKGVGIGEWIETDIVTYGAPVESFIISIGYVSFLKPGLYTANARPKKIRISSTGNGTDFIADVDDSRNLQVITLPKAFSGGKGTFKFEILEVYAGTKYDDTCINFIIPLGKFMK